MAAISIIEFGVYGFITYLSLAMLIISTIKDNVPNKKLDSIARSIFFIPGIICAVLLAQGGPDILLDTVEPQTITNNTVSIIFYEDTITTDKFVLQDPIWAILHMMIFFVLVTYFIRQMLLLLAVKD